MEFLKDCKTFRLTLSNKYKTFDEENMEVNPHWECLKKTWTSTREEVLGKKKRQESVKTDKVNFIDSLAKGAEEAAARRNMKQLYDTTRKLAGKFKQAERPIKDKDGVILTSEEDQMGRWRDHFEELLNRPAPSNPPDIPRASEVLDVNCERPDREEIREAISLLKAGKAPGPDEILEEAIKTDIETSIEMLYDLIGNI